MTGLSIGTGPGRAGPEMEDPTPPEFGSLEEELRFWKEQAARNQQRFVLVSFYWKEPGFMLFVLY